MKTYPLLVNMAGIDPRTMTPTGNVVRQTLTAHLNAADAALTAAEFCVDAALPPATDPRQVALTLRDRHATLLELHSGIGALEKRCANWRLSLARRLSAAQDAYAAAYDAIAAAEAASGTEQV